MLFAMLKSTCMIAMLSVVLCIAQVVHSSEYQVYGPAEFNNSEQNITTTDRFRNRYLNGFTNLPASFGITAYVFMPLVATFAPEEYGAFYMLLAPIFGVASYPYDYDYGLLVTSEFFAHGAINYFELSKDHYSNVERFGINLSMIAAMTMVDIYWRQGDENKIKADNLLLNFGFNTDNAISAEIHYRIE